MMRKSLLILGFIIGLNQWLDAQSDCNNYLEQAKGMMKLGQYYNALNIIKECSVGDTNKIRQWQAPRLLAECYLELDSAEKAEMEVKKMLQINPLYKKSFIEDSKKLRILISQVPRIPRYTLSFYVAANYTFPQILKRFETTETIKNYDSPIFDQHLKKPGQGIGLKASYGISEKISFHTGAGYFENIYQLNYSLQDINSTDFTSTDNNLTFQYAERLRFIQVPLLVQCQVLSVEKRRFYVQAGYNFGILTKSNYDIDIFNVKGTATNLDPRSNIDNHSSKKPFKHSIVLGTGGSYELFEGHVFIDLNYDFSLNRINQDVYPYLDRSLISDYYFINDDLKLNSLNISLGYTFYFKYFVK